VQSRVLRWARGWAGVSALLLAVTHARAEGTKNESWWRRWSSPSQVQYGVAFDGEFVLAPGGICDPSAPCILGSGGGVSVRFGVLYGRATYLGLTYSLTKQDPARLYRFATLQQGRLEFRKYLDSERDVRLFGGVGVGLAGYGDQWGVDTFGPVGSIGGGLEIELSARTVVVTSLAYRLIRLSSFRDSSNLDRPAGYTHILGLELALEARSPIE